MLEKEVYTVVGLMSGTSLDGVDAALIETDGRDYVNPLAFYTAPYTASEREAIRACFGKVNRADPLVVVAEDILAQTHAKAVLSLLEKADRKASDVDCIGFHGQTIHHAPAQRITVQIGDAWLLARLCGVDVVANFRSADVAAGGEGAPLAPLYHAARVKSAGLCLPVVILNIGGVANVTWIGHNPDDVLAFDTGTGNALMDDWVLSRTGQRYDEEGLLAARGRARESLVKNWLAESYFSRKPPKSLDRNAWSVADLSCKEQAFSTEDGAATLLAFTVEGIVKSLEHMPVRPESWYVCGGGRHNPTLMRSLSVRLAEEGAGAVYPVEALSWNGDATEAECFGYLAVRSRLGLPLSLPTTTGVLHPVCGGVFFPCKGQLP